MKLLLTTLKSILAAMVWMITVLFTGGKYGSSVPGDGAYAYKKSQDQKRKDFAEYGGRSCKVCGTRIPGNKSYCGPCYYKYIK